MIGVLIVDDERLTRELHANFVARIDGFAVVAECAGARAAVSAVLDARGPEAIDLILLDMTMPDGHGLDVARHIRARGVTVDIIAITGVRDAEVVRQAAALGVAQYLIKPFTFATFQDRMVQYAAYRQKMADAAGPATQAEIDALFGALRPTVAEALPKGLSAPTLDRVAAALRNGGPFSSREAAERLGMSRVSVRRYLEHLVGIGRAERDARHGTPGRPETEYRWMR
ncbi:response regulator [Microbacterium sp. cx-55]|uniref:response regulator n=1 Tax=Microbacterium sp. cx-55 TaxID=2875948 RepID=UPI001CBE00D5|nr:response regulator [Microbacterium sp. cx-55]MBZ4487503.1 response regulator [Microbacterium sp. cx-55]UGB35523.1 response regulator [Microbacterium sp. cx-55]